MSRRPTKPQPRAATWLTRQPIAEPRGWMRADPGYDEHRPLDRGDIAAMVRMIPAAVVFLAGLLAAFLLIAAFTAPVPK